MRHSCSLTLSTVYGDADDVAADVGWLFVMRYDFTIIHAGFGFAGFQVVVASFVQI